MGRKGVKLLVPIPLLVRRLSTLLIRVVTLPALHIRAPPRILHALLHASPRGSTPACPPSRAWSMRVLCAAWICIWP